MTDAKHDWDELRGLWQATPARELPDLTPQLARRTRWIWLLTALDIVATVAILIAIAWVARDGLDAPERWYAGFALVLLAIGWPVTLAARRGSWVLREAGPVSAIEFAIRRCTASIRLARMNQGAVLIGLGAGVALQFADSQPPAPDLLTNVDPWLRRSVALVAFALWMAGAEWYARRKRRERDRLAALLAECSEP